ARDLRIGLGLDWGNSAPGCVVWGAALPDEHITVFDEFKFQRMTHKDAAAAPEGRRDCDQREVSRLAPAARSSHLLRPDAPACEERRTGRVDRPDPGAPRGAGRQSAPRPTERRGES